MRHNKVVTRVAVVLLFTLVILALSQNNRNAFADTVEVEILKGATTLGDRSYSPNPIQITVGDTIRFVNKDSALHTATSGSGGSIPQPSNVFDSGYIGPNKVAEVTINEIGEFPYYCELHPTMVGLVKVSSGSTSGGDQFKLITAFDGKIYEVVGHSSANANATGVVISPGISVMVNFDGSGDVELTLPTDMISNITAVIVGTESMEPEIVEVNAASTTISFEVPEGETSVKIMGGFVVPEFPVVAALVLGGSLVVVISIARIVRGPGDEIGSAAGTS